jgi:hypothetical protein
VLRRISRAHRDDTLTPSFIRLAFDVKSQDVDGLSVFLERPDQANPGLLDAGGRKPGSYYVVRFSVGELGTRLGLHVVPTFHLDSIPGHCSIPELSATCLQADPAAVKSLQLELCRMADEPGRIALAPTT